MARTAVSMMERPFLVTLFITFSKVSSRITRSNSCEHKTAHKTVDSSTFLSFCSISHTVNDISYQKAVEELMNKEAQDADDGVTQMVDEEHVHHHCFVSSGERSLVAHKTYKKDQLVEQLKIEQNKTHTL